MPEARVIRSIHEVTREAWDACFAGELEGYDYLAAVEAAGLPGFDWRYVLMEQDGRLLAAAPAFFTDYRLDTTLTAFGRGLVAATRRLAQRAFTVRLASLGSPCTEDVGLGFHPEITAIERPALLRLLLAAFEASAAEDNCWLLAIKDAPDTHGLWPVIARSAGYQFTPGMPSAELLIDFPDMDAYLARLSAGTRKDMRRKLKALSGLRIERRNDIVGLEDRVMDLYRQTRRRSDLQFEELTPAYFTGVLERMGERASCVLYYADGDLLGFNLLLQDGETLLDKYFCMESERGPEHNLYFVSWFTNVRLCLEAGLKRYQSGQAGYGAKVRLGSGLAPTQMYFRHRRALVNQALRWAAPLLSDDPAGENGAMA
jgi:hypothetical protein